MSPTFHSLSVRNYRIFAAGGIVSNTGTWMGRVAQDLATYLGIARRKVDVVPEGPGMEPAVEPTEVSELRARLGLPYWSLSRYLKLKVKRAVSFIGDFETAVIREAKRRGVDGVVCGHIHHAELRTVDGLTYANDGDWVESLTALVEHGDGRLEVIDWAEVLRQRQRAAAPALPLSITAT